MKIYLACPYNHSDPGVREQRFKVANEAAGQLMQNGNIIYSPISHSHPIAVQCNLPKDWDYWKMVDEFFISVCDEVWVLTLPGWQDSVGVKKEIKIAKKLGKPVKYLKF